MRCVSFQIDRAVVTVSVCWRDGGQQARAGGVIGGTATEADRLGPGVARPLKGWR